MTICSFCPLLCELINGESTACQIRDRQIASLTSIARSRSAFIDGQEVTIDRAIQKANELLLNSEQRVITGGIRSVDGARAAVSLASRIGAFIDPARSDDAFKNIVAVQRTGMTTASMSEVRFRSDCLVLIGDDRVFELFPRLGDILLRRSNDRMSATQRHIVAMGKWTSQNLAKLRSISDNVCSIDIDLQKVPQALFQWARCREDTLSTSDNLASKWMSQANYLSLIWSPACVPMPQADLWIERLLQWIEHRNEIKRCVGFPLANEYVTFQQVCTWTTGFPGRVHIDGDAFRYDPNRALTAKRSDSQTHSISIQIDELLDGESRFEQPTIAIGPRFDPRATAPRVFIPCAIPGIDHPAIFFRVDATVAAECFDRSSPSENKGVLTVAEILSKLGRPPAC